MILLQESIKKLINMEKEKIIIVEDEGIVAMHLESILENLGFEVYDVYDNGKVLLQDLKEQEDLDIDLIIMDIKIKGTLSGIETIKQIKEFSDVPFIYLTSNSDDSTIEEAKSTKPLAFLKKPFEEAQLKATISTSLFNYRERKKEQAELDDKFSMQQQNIKELEETNQHLITATWRERELKQELQKTKEIVDNQNKKILDSINYSHRIQSSIIPSKYEMKSVFSDSFILYKPKDIVSGDFPWMYSKGSYTYIAAVDCTGHGVPGAMMSIIGNLLLKDIINVNIDKKPHQILEELHKAVVKTLRQDVDENNASDGMDIALCRIDNSKREVMFSGAHRPLYQLRGKELEEYKGDKLPIGGVQYDKEITFTNHVVDVKKGDKFFMFSDGFPDQFGGPRGLKYGPKRIRRVIQEHAHFSMDEFDDLFFDEFSGWIGKGRQIDDVLMIGFSL